jgi:hypothetical protein
MSLSILKSPRKRNNLIMCIGILLLVVLVLWFVLGKKQECPKKQHKIIVPIGNGKKVALTKEEYESLSKYKSNPRENFYVSSQDYIPSVRTENEYAPMLSLYKPKEPTKVEPTPVPIVAPIVAPMVVPTATGTMVVPAKNEPYGNVFLDNIVVPPESEEGKKYRAKLAELSPFFLNNGEIIQA